MKKKHVIWLACALIIMESCKQFGSKIVKGNGVSGQVFHSITPFTKLNVEGIATVHLSQGDFKPIRIVGDENLLPFILVTQTGDELTIHNKMFHGLETKTSIDVFVSAPVYRSIEMSGVGDINSVGKLVSTDSIFLTLNSSSNMNIEIEGSIIKAVIDGVGSMKLKGSTKDLDLVLNNGSANCFDLKADDVIVKNHGIGEADVFAFKTLSANADEIGGIVYKGDPGIISKELGKLSTIRKAE